MWTVLNPEKTIIERPLKQLEARCQNVVNNMNNNWDSIEFEYNGEVKKINIFNSMIYILSKLSTEDTCMTLVKKIGLPEIKSISEWIIEDLKPKGKGKNTYVKKDADRLTNGNIEAYTQVALGDNSKYVYFYRNIKEIFNSKAGYAGSILAEVAAVAYFAVNSPLNQILINPFSLHCIAIYYWSFEKLGMAKFGTSITKAYPFRSRYKPGLNFNEFLNSIIKDKRVYNTAIKYYSNLLDNDISTFAYYNLMEEFIESARIQVKSDEEIYSFFDEIKTNIKDGNRWNSASALLSLTGKKSITKYTYIAMTAGAIIPKLFMLYSYESVVLYVLKQYYDLDNKNIVSKSNMDLIKLIAEEHSNNLNSSNNSNRIEVIYNSIPKVLRELNRMEEEQSRLKEKIDSQNTKIDNLRASLKDSTKTVKQLKDEKSDLEALNKKLDTQVKYDIKPEDVKELKSRVDRSKETIEKLQAELNNLERQLSKKDKEVESLKAKLDKAETDYLELVEEHDRIKEINNRLNKHREFSEIEIKCFVNAIRRYKIALIGGDMMYDKLRNVYQLTNIAYHKAGCRDIKPEDLVNKDLVVMATAFLDHASTDLVARASRMSNIPVIRYNNKNVDMLIYTLFSELYK